MPSPRIIIVTGANRGIGRAICSQILSRPDLGPLKLFATSRKGDFSLTSDHAEGKEVLYPRLDVSDEDSIRALRHEVGKHGDVSVLINNAAVNLDQGYGPETVRETLDINYRGTVDMCRTFLSHFSPQGGRIVNLASVASSLKPYGPAIQDRLRNPDASLEDLEQLAEEYESSVRTHTEVAAGFGTPVRSYAFSKALLRAATSILARITPNSNVLINSCCPGWVSTDMGSLVGSTKTKPPKTPDQGARIPLRLAFDDLQDITGQYWANDSVRSKDLGKVQTEW